MLFIYSADPWISPSCSKTGAQSDLVAAVIVALMLVPQSLAYAMLAGLPPQVGLCASILPLMVSAIFGTSGKVTRCPIFWRGQGAPWAV